MTLRRNTTLLSTTLGSMLVALAALGFFMFGRHNAALRPGTTWTIHPPSPGDQAPLFTLPDVNGRTVSLSDYRGKVVLLNFWATTCSPCKQEIPDFIDLQSRYGNKGLQVIGIGLDEPSELKRFAAQNGMNYEVLLGKNEVAWRYSGNSGVPRTFVIDKHGAIVRIFEGYRSVGAFDDEVRRLLQ